MRQNYPLQPDHHVAFAHEGKHVRINGELADPRKHNIGFIFQEPSCLPWRTVWDDIKFGLEIKGYDEGEINKRVTQIIELVGFKGFESFYPRQLSGGMKQRVLSPGPL